VTWTLVFQIAFLVCVTAFAVALAGAALVSSVQSERRQTITLADSLRALRSKGDDDGRSS